jgi:hypothetical protein
MGAVLLVGFVEQPSDARPSGATALTCNWPYVRLL